MSCGCWRRCEERSDVWGWHDLTDVHHPPPAACIGPPPRRVAPERMPYRGSPALQPGNPGRDAHGCPHEPDPAASSFIIALSPRRHYLGTCMSTAQPGSVSGLQIGSRGGCRPAATNAVLPPAGPRAELDVRSWSCVWTIRSVRDRCSTGATDPETDRAARRLRNRPGHRSTGRRRFVVDVRVAVVECAPAGRRHIGAERR